MDVPVFKRWVYQTPALVYKRESGTLLVFSSVTAGGTSRKLLMKRGVVKKSSDTLSLEFDQKKMVKEADLPGHSSINPCPVFDEKENKLFLFFIISSTEQQQEEHPCHKTRLCYLTSDNFGESWSEVTHLTACLPEHCVTLAIGPGHGLQTKNGRLIIPTYACVDENPADDKPVPHAVALYSDDGGESWQFGSLIQDKSAGCQMAEIWGEEGRLIYCNASNESGRLVEAFSKDNGDTFVVSEGGKLTNTPSGNQGSLLSLPVQNAAAVRSDASCTLNQWLLFTQPNSAGTELRVYVNKTPSDPNAWTAPWILNRGPSGHSDMVYLGDGCIACIFETGEDESIDSVAMKIFFFSDIKPNTEDKTNGRPCMIM
nr:sialidase-4-like [Nothobranchius furzeri]